MDECKPLIMGPSWIALHGAGLVPSNGLKSWCKLEVMLPLAHKSVRPPASSDGGAVGGVSREAGAYTRPLFSSA